MNQKTRYVASLSALAVFVSLATIMVQRHRFVQAEDQKSETRVTLSMGMVKNVGQLRQIETINSQIDRKEPLSDAQVDQLLAVITGPPDVILQAHAEASLISAQDEGCLSPSQKSEIATKNLVALKNPELAVRQFAISLEGELGEKSSIPALLPFLNAPQPRVRQLTKEALEKLQN